MGHLLTCKHEGKSINMARGFKLTNGTFTCAILCKTPSHDHIDVQELWGTQIILPSLSFNSFLSFLFNFFSFVQSRF